MHDLSWLVDSKQTKLPQKWDYRPGSILDGPAPKNSTAGVGGFRIPRNVYTFRIDQNEMGNPTMGLHAGLLTSDASYKTMEKTTDTVSTNQK
jgi:hypothetical protein